MWKVSFLNINCYIFYSAEKIYIVFCIFIFLFVSNIVIFLFVSNIDTQNIDLFYRYRIEGYAALPIPMTPGRYEFTIPTWRAKGSIIDTLRRFFVGGSYELEDITYCSIPMSHEGKVLDKSNLKVVPSGDIKIYMNIIFQSGAHTKYSNYQRDDSNKMNTDMLMNNVENVLEQFKAAKERMIRIKAMNS